MSRDNNPSKALSDEFGAVRMSSNDFNLGQKAEELGQKDRKYLRMNGLSDKQVEGIAAASRESAKHTFHLH